MKSGWEAQPLFPNRRRFGRVGGFSVKISGWLLVRSPSGPSTLATSEPTTSPQSGRLGDPTLPATAKEGSAQKDAKIAMIQIGKHPATLFVGGFPNCEEPGETPLNWLAMRRILASTQNRASAPITQRNRPRNPPATPSDAHGKTRL